MRTNEKEIANIEEYINIINSIQKSKDTINSVQLYRGSSSKYYQCIPSIGRQIDAKIHNKYIDFETNITNKAQLRMPELFIDHKYPIQILTTLQHYGLPTRLLDFTRNSLIALYFACQNSKKNNETDGKVLVVLESEYNIYTSFSPFINAIADMFYLNNFNLSLEDYLHNIENNFYWDIIDYNHFKESERISKFKERLRPTFFEPICNFDRLKRQQGLFLIFPNNLSTQNKETEEVCYITTSLSKWTPIQAIEIIIPHKIKKTLLKSLKNMGITKSFLFPEPENVCLDICEEIKNSY